MARIAERRGGFKDPRRRGPDGDGVPFAFPGGNVKDAAPVLRRFYDDTSSKS